MLTIYGIPKSRAFRCIWAAEEAGIPYAIEPVSFGADSKTPEFLGINPNGKVPAMRDGDLILFESLAINLHIARRAGAPLMPTGNAAALVEQWTLWSATEVEPNAGRWSLNTIVRPPEKRIAAEAAAGTEGLNKALTVLDAHLAAGPWLLGAEFSIADASLAAVLYGTFSNGFDYTPFPKVTAWMQACLARPAAMRALAIRNG